jgi:8-oxo-dGTP pyrophosphatase MutT (NUDIX family)
MPPSDWLVKLRSQLQAPPARPLLEREAWSSVLILVGENKEIREECVLLTKRTHSVETHKGQISFPGGFWEPEDEDLLKTALRESKEEIGLAAEQVHVVGALTPVQTRQGVHIQPWVGAIEFPPSFSLSKDEVEKILFLPLRTLLDKGLEEVNVQMESGFTVKSRGLFLAEDLVWGATARILENLRALILQK